jgi:quercetin dioxygenase-like cupin family protein
VVSGVVSAASAPHYAWGDGCDGWHLLRSGTLSVIQERMPPGTAEVRHRHAKAQQLFFVLAGALAIEVEGEVRRLGPRDALHVPPGARHLVRNDGAADAEFLVISQPPSHDDRENLP